MRKIADFIKTLINASSKSEWCLGTKAAQQQNFSTDM